MYIINTWKSSRYWEVAFRYNTGAAGVFPVLDWLKCIGGGTLGDDLHEATVEDRLLKGKIHKN